MLIYLHVPSIFYVEGVSWKLLRVFDSNLHWGQPLFHYLLLPAASRTRNTRFRWWQTRDDVTGSADDVGWSLDDVHVGGFVINSAFLTEDFEQFPGNICGSLFLYLHMSYM